MSRQTKDQRVSRQVFNQKVREYLVILTDENEAERLLERYQTELEKCRKDHWRPETAGTAAFLGFFHERNL